MELVNKTRYPAEMPTTLLDDDRMLAAVVIKAQFTLDGRKLKPLSEQDWEIGPPKETPWGTLDEETPFRKQGVDLMVLGSAYPEPGGRGNTGQVEVRVADRRYAMAVFGKRNWKREGERLVATAPEPFEEIPMTWENAYGGKCAIETGEMPFHANPVGTGFYVDEESAEDGELPHFEDPENLIETWQDQPDPRGVAPLSRESSLRIMNSAEFDTEAEPPKIKHILPSYFNNANPSLILDFPLEPGTPIGVRGVTPSGEMLGFRVPDGEFHVHVQLADRGYVFPALLDSVLFMTRERQVVLGFRCCFRYSLNPRERRMATVRAGPCPASVPEAYGIDWDALDAERYGNDT